jgi:outer membrane lipoprotein SlyB
MRIPMVGAVLALALLSGCATTQYRPLVDSGVSRGDYDDDVADCQQLADQRPAAAQAAGGAAVGAVLGALLGVAVGLRGNDVANVAAWGAANGGIQGAAYGSAEQQEIVSRCMAERGYNVVAN